MRKMMMLAVLGAAVALVAAGCSSQPKMSKSGTTKSSDEPVWVSKPYIAFPEDVGKAFYGVGIAESKESPLKQQRRTMATERAKRDLAGQLRTFVQSVFKDYSEAAFTPSSKTAEARNLSETVTKSIIDETLMGVEQKDLWAQPETEDFYALVRLSADTVAQQLRSKIIAAEQDRLRTDAATAHKDLDQIIDKNRQNLK